ncbi:hypothetical protein ACHAXR_000603, partial [Thalassiosira sp. AJA248-18]
VYNGTGKFYVDYQNEICVEDCEVGGNATNEGSICGGIIEENWVELYDDAATCCGEKLGYVQYCAETSMGIEPEGSLKWYVDYEGKKCSRDCSVDDGSTPSPTPLDTLDGSLDPLAATSSPTADPLGTGNATNATEFDQCGGLTTPDVQLFDSETVCCESVLAYISLPFCEGMSAEGVFNGTGKFYVDYQNEICVEDCEVDGEATNGGICGGIIEESWVELFDDAASCCDSKLSYVQYCAENSLGIEPEGSLK